jgi:hypothetical protein
MNIDYAIVSSDDSEYFDYWPIIYKAWKKIGIEPILFYVSEDEVFGDNIIWLKKVDGIKTSLQSQIARIWAYKVLTGNLLTSDIDMMPLSKDYFINNSKYILCDHIVSYCSDAKYRFDGTEPMCYILANDKTMKELIPHHTWEEFVIDLAEKGGHGWSTDQWYFTKIINQYDQSKVVRLSRGWNEGGAAFNRLDRLYWRYDENEVKAGLVYDAHLLRPFKSNENEIIKLYNLIA